MLEKRIKSPVLRAIAEWLISLGLAALLFFALREFVFRTAHVDGSSMMPTLAHGDMIILNRVPYNFSPPRVGDIVAFPNPDNREVYYIKRIIAASGDEVDLRDGVFYINDIPLDDYFSQSPTLSLGDVVFPITVEYERFFVLGDNRNGSQDSRFSSVGNILADDMIGRASLRIWQLGRVGRVE